MCNKNVSLSSLVLHTMKHTVVDQDAQLAKRLHVAIHRLLAVFLLFQIHRQQICSPPSLLNLSLCVLCILLFLWQIYKGNVGTLLGHEDSNGPADT